MIYLHRYLRLTPLLGISILFTVSLLRYLGNGPLWPTIIGAFEQRCENNWMTTLLYIQNYVNPSELVRFSIKIQFCTLLCSLKAKHAQSLMFKMQCLGHSWYLSIDMQLFLIAPIIIYLIFWFKKKAIVILSIFVLGCVGCTIAVHLKYNLKWL